MSTISIGDLVTTDSFVPFVGIYEGLDGVKNHVIDLFGRGKMYSKNPPNLGSVLHVIHTYRFSEWHFRWWSDNYASHPNSPFRIKRTGDRFFIEAKIEDLADMEKSKANLEDAINLANRLNLAAQAQNKRKLNFNL